mgnify:CR=1 FL=1|tara:strand:- start:734 stop:883 length:150 start_codon:yes stop_codon:yes gene_type:complete
MPSYLVAKGFDGDLPFLRHDARVDNTKDMKIDPVPLNAEAHRGPKAMLE